MVKKIFIVLLILIFGMFTLTGCYNAEGLETLAYAVAIGIDKGKNDKIRLSLQFAVLSESSSEASRKQSITKIYNNNG